MAKIRILLWVMVAIVSGVAGYAVMTQDKPSGRQQSATVKIGGPFTLVDNKGQEITQAAFDGRNHAIFFGFTNCPDICPTTLLEVAGWLKAMEGDADKVDFYFFTVDPERDTVEVMNDYVTAFDSRITGVTGDTEEMMRAIRSYKAYAKRVDLDDGDYTMDHSAFVMLFSEDGDFEGTIAYGENDETAVAKLKRLAENG